MNLVWRDKGSLDFDVRVCAADLTAFAGGFFYKSRPNRLKSPWPQKKKSHKRREWVKNVSEWEEKKGHTRFNVTFNWKEIPKLIICFSILAGAHTHFNFSSIFIRVFYHWFSIKKRFIFLLLARDFVDRDKSTIEHCQDWKNKLKFVGFYSSSLDALWALEMSNMAHGSN